jgi:ATP-dependent DNA ligase
VPTSPAERAPAGPDWLHEIKHDGFRLLARRGAERVRLFTRNGHDWTERFPLIAEALNALKVTTCLLDGEAVTCTGAGLADFDQLRYKHGDVHLCAFDLVESNQPPSSIPTDDGGLAHSRGGFL